VDLPKRPAQFWTGAVNQAFPREPILATLNRRRQHQDEKPFQKKRTYGG
jgi:hypothetical protein